MSIPDQVPDYLTTYGLRTVDGGCNNLAPAALLNPDGSPATNADGTPILKYQTGRADEQFTRLSAPVFRAAEPITPAFPVGPPGPTTYAQKSGSVIDSQPRVVSNLIVDQTETNPAAIAAAGFPVRTQGNIGTAPCITQPSQPGADDGLPAGCTPAHHTLFIPNVTTDVGLSPPYNSMFTFFGQFFDHGVDQTVKGGGTVFVPLKADDPLRTVGPDGIAGTGDEVPPQQAFMVLTRAKNQPGPDGILATADDIQDADNTDSPWVDQSQTYTSHAAHQVFLREYAMNAANRPVATGKLLGGIVTDRPITTACTTTATCLNDGNATTGSISTWASTKKQAAEKLGLLLRDRDVTNVPMLAVDPYGNFLPGPARGLPQYVTASGLVEGNLAAPVPVPVDVVYFDTPFLTDIAHNADPSPQDTDNNPGTPPVRPTPDADLVASADFLNQPAGTYDDEMLNAHFICGDGRCNENIALTAIHQVFHHEHDRLIDDIKSVLAGDNTPGGREALPEWKVPTTAAPDGWNGSRLFQAARFITEMEYQHLVFEDFARKVQPLIRPFHVYNPDINAAIPAEFAAAVYRFGHSMLDDEVIRTNEDGSDNSLPLLDAFLNPPEYFNGGTAGTLTPEQAAGTIVMGSSDQVGNELDEFVVETLRNNLLGLPLDLAAINMARAREVGVPPLNQFRRQVFASTNDGQLAPYTSWSDFGQHLKHPESLINFVAAYGTHPTITAATTAAGKRAAARAIVDPIEGDVPPADAADFMFSVDTFATPPGGLTTTGLDNVDMWVGGLAEVTNVFGGLLGSTFNYVFQLAMENLQEGDRFYYLARTPGMNLRAQLEGNSFAELIVRNTDGTHTIKADAFATADCKFELGQLTFPAPAGSPVTGAGSVADDPTSDCDENRLLLHQPDGTFQYRQFNSVDPSGINGQGVYNGTASNDRAYGGNDNDTFWGGPGRDVIEGNGGDDIALGGEGNDTLTDLSGFDVLKGGPGNDAIDTGIGDDISMGGDGQDFMNGGANDNEAFAGPGNDFVIAGQGADVVLGDSGDDWIQGGSGQDLLEGDHAAPFFDDPAQARPGNDIFIGQVGENDYDGEGGDDLMSQNAAIDRNAGSAGFDWAFHQYDTVGADDDMLINQQLVGLPIQIVVNRDRWQEMEALSGSRFNDTLRGDSIERIVGPGGFAGCDALDPIGVARIAGLNRLVTSFPTPLGGIIDESIMEQCPLIGFGEDPSDVSTGTVWTEGNIILGGGGNDLIDGRGNDDIVDGDHALRVAITVRTDPTNPASEIGRTDLMENKATSGGFGPGTAGMTLQQAVFAGLVDPGHLVAVREIADPSGLRMGPTAYTGLPADCPVPTPDGIGGRTVKLTPSTTNCDTAAFFAQVLTAGLNGAFDPTTQYTIVNNTDGSITVTDALSVGDPAIGDGAANTLWNIENLRFCVGTSPDTGDCNAFYDLPVTPTVPVAAPAIELSASSLTFASADTGPPAGPRTVTVTNVGTAPLIVAPSTVNNSRFSVTDNCTTVAPSAYLHRDGCVRTRRPRPADGNADHRLQRTGSEHRRTGRNRRRCSGGRGGGTLVGVRDGGHRHDVGREANHGQQHREGTADVYRHRRRRWRCDAVHGDAGRLRHRRRRWFVHRRCRLRPDERERPRAEGGGGPFHAQQQERPRIGLDGDAERNRRRTSTDASLDDSGDVDDRADLGCALVERAVDAGGAGGPDVRAIGTGSGVGHPWWQQGGKPRRQGRTADAVAVRSRWFAERWHQCGGVERDGGRWWQPDDRWRLRHGVPVWHPSRGIEFELLGWSDDPELGHRAGVGFRHGVLLRVRHGAPPRRRVGVLPGGFRFHVVGSDTGDGHPWWNQDRQRRRHRRSGDVVAVRSRWTAGQRYRCGGVERHRGRRCEPDDRWWLRHGVSVRYASGGVQPELHDRSNDPELGHRAGVGDGDGVFLRVRHGAPARRRGRVPPGRFRVHLVGAGARDGHPGQRQGRQRQRQRHAVHAVAVGAGRPAERCDRCGGVERDRRRRCEPDDRWWLRHGVSVRYPPGCVESELHDRSDDPELGDRAGVGGRHGVLLRVRHGAPAR